MLKILKSFRFWLLVIALAFYVVSAAMPIHIREVMPILSIPGALVFVLIFILGGILSTIFGSEMAAPLLVFFLPITVFLLFYLVGLCLDYISHVIRISKSNYKEHGDIFKKEINKNAEKGLTYYFIKIIKRVALVVILLLIVFRVLLFLLALSAPDNVIARIPSPHGKFVLTVYETGRLTMFDSGPDTYFYLRKTSILSL